MLLLLFEQLFYFLKTILIFIATVIMRTEKTISIYWGGKDTINNKCSLLYYIKAKIIWAYIHSQFF